MSRGPIFDPGWCRCCGEMRKCRDLTIEYQISEQTETYCDMLMDCFGLLLANLDTEPTERLICIICIQRLRDAFHFCQQVLQCEEVFMQMKMESADTESTAEQPDMEDPKIDLDVNVELRHSEASSSRDSLADDVSDYQFIANSGDDCNLNEEMPVQRIVTTNLSKQKAEETPPKSDNCGRKILDLQPSSAVMSKDPKYPTKKSIMSQRLLGKSCEFVSKTEKALEETEKLAQISNISTLLQNSNVTPFKGRSRLGFRCYYCRHILKSLETLKEHQTTHHQRTDLKKILSGFDNECLVVNVDVTDLKCTICDESILGLNDMKTHLIEKHDKSLYLKYNDRVIPFNISSSNLYECQICAFNFKTFGSTERHMNVHFRNYVCKECDAGFVTKYRLKVHINTMHARGSFQCDVCKKVFTTQKKQKNHVNTVHKLIKRFKCPKCGERFSEYFRRQKHLIEAHGMIPLQHVCNICNRSFYRRQTLSRHMKRDHLEERNLKCPLCTYKCFTNNELKVHMIKHNGERVHECFVCKKSFARVKTLREHVRLHKKDRRFACAICDQVFVQKCNLRAHMKSHRLENSMQ